MEKREGDCWEDSERLDGSRKEMTVTLMPNWRKLIPCCIVVYASTSMGLQWASGYLLLAYLAPALVAVPYAVIGAYFSWRRGWEDERVATGFWGWFMR